MVDVTVAWTRLDGAPADAAFLDGEQRRRLEGFRFEGDRRRFVGARLLLRQVVAGMVGCAPEEVALHQHCQRCGGAHGRPRVEVLGRPGPEVSFAHADEVAVVAVSSTPVGVDVEPRGAGATADWLRMEAMVKATGEGLTGPPQRVRARRQRTQLRDLELGPDYSGAVAALGRGRLRIDLSEERLRPEAAGASSP